MRIVLLFAFVTGTTFFAVLPVYAPPVVLQEDEVSRFLSGLAASAVAGAALGSLAGFARGVLLVVACAFVGVVLHAFLYAIPTYQSGSAWSVVAMFTLVTFFYVFLPATVGVALAGSARGAIQTLLRRDRTRS